MKHDELDDQNVIARWSSRGMTTAQRVAKASAVLDEFMEERIAEFEVDMQDAGADMDELAKMMARRRTEYAKWKTETLAELARWFERGGETLN
jgi:hypothetical protein